MSLTSIWKNNLAKRINATENFKVNLPWPELKRTQCDNARRGPAGRTDAVCRSHRKPAQEHTWARVWALRWFRMPLPSGSQGRRFCSVTRGNSGADLTARQMAQLTHKSPESWARAQEGQGVLGGAVLRDAEHRTGSENANSGELWWASTNPSFPKPAERACFYRHHVS